jgi:two-component system OmpR family response regulator
MTARKQILIVDDDKEITTMLPQYLVSYGYEAYAAGDADSMQHQLSQHAIDLIILDVMLPGTDGLALAREMRKQSRLPIIMLTARTNPYDRVVGLETGADDYMGKPFEPRELVARIQSVLRRASSPPRRPTDHTRSDMISFDGWELHRENHCLHAPDGAVVALSNAEFRLMCLLLQTPRRALKRDQLMEQGSSHTMDSGERSIDLLVSRLRQKLIRTPGGFNMIKTVRGVGYMLNAQSVQGRMVWRS